MRFGKRLRKCASTELDTIRNLSKLVLVGHIQLMYALHFRYMQTYYLFTLKRQVRLIYTFYNTLLTPGEEAAILSPLS